MRKVKISKSPLLLRYEALKRRSRKLNDDWAKFSADATREAVAGGCLHEVTGEGKRHDDNGYGRWWTTFYTECALCGTILNKRVEDGMK